MRTPGNSSRTGDMVAKISGTSGVVHLLFCGMATGAFRGWKMKDGVIQIHETTLPYLDFIEEILLEELIKQGRAEIIRNGVTHEKNSSFVSPLSSVGYRGVLVNRERVNP